MKNAPLSLYASTQFGRIAGYVLPPLLFVVANREPQGKGLYTGGNGTIREILARRTLRFSILSERRVYAPYGMAGGAPGAKGENLVWKRNGEGVLEKISLGGKAVVVLDEGEIIRICTPGGGGWGVPVNV